MSQSLFKANVYLNLFGLLKIPLLLFCRPRILKNDAATTVVRIKLRRRTKNHLGSMYFGALAVGADITGGFSIFEKVRTQGMKASISFKDLNAEFHKMALADVHFTCHDGEKMAQMLAASKASGERVNQPVTVVATCPSIDDDPVATFQLTLSIKVK